MSAIPEVIPTAAESWFADRNWKPFPFQRAALQRKSGLLKAITGSGKTYAVWLAALLRAAKNDMKSKRAISGLRVLWITRMRALTADSPVPCSNHFPLPYFTPAI